MSDEAQDTPVAATKSLLGALAFILLLLGAEMIAEKDGVRWGTGFFLVLSGVVCTYAAVFWNFVRKKLPKGATAEINTIATSPRWWLGLLLVLLASLVFMPVIQRPRWPSWPQTTLSTIPTSLRLQFNAKGTNPQEIEKQNIEWAASSVIERRQGGTEQKYVCDPNSRSNPLSSLTNPSLAPSMNCAYESVPQYVELQNWIIFLSFEKPIAAKEIKVNSHGAPLPKWETSSLSNNVGYIYFHGDLTRLILDIEVLN